MSSVVPGSVTVTLRFVTLRYVTKNRKTSNFDR